MNIEYVDNCKSTVKWLIWLLDDAEGNVASLENFLKDQRSFGAQGIEDECVNAKVCSKYFAVEITGEFYIFLTVIC